MTYAPSSADGDDQEPQSSYASQAPIIAVASGKGGVGKSTVAVNRALALRAGPARRRGRH